MADEVEFILERLGSQNDVIKIDKEFISCGRMKDNDIVCLSLLVSRQHCSFLKFSTGLYVADLGSSNGVYVNGTEIPKKVRFSLQHDDIVGIGCQEIKNLSSEMFVYRVKRKENITCTIDLDDSSNDRQTVKEQSKQRRDNVDYFPNKVMKTSEKHEQVISNSNSNDDDDIVEIFQTKDTVNTAKPDSPKSVKKEEHSASSNGLINCNNSNSNTVPKIVVDTVVIDLSDPEDTNCNEVEKLSVNNIKLEAMQIDENKQIKTHETPGEDVNSDKAIVNIKQEPVISVKQEPDWSHFSQIDIIEIDDDSIFTQSQNHENINIKEEREEGDDNDNEGQTSLFLDDEDENVITILDSDDEDDKVDGVVSGVDYSCLIPFVKIEPGVSTSNVESTGLVDEVHDPFEDLNLDDEQINKENSEIESNAIHEEALQQEKQLPTSTKSNERSENVLGSSNNGTQFTNLQTPVSDDSNSLLQCASESNNKKSLQENQKSNSLHEKSSDKKSHSKKKGIEIVEPHHMTSGRRRRSKSKSRHESSKDKSKKSKHHSKSSSSSSKSKSSSSTDSNKEQSSHKSSDKDSSSTESNNNKTTESPNRSHVGDGDVGHESSNSVMHSRPKTKNVKAKISKKSRGDMLCDSMLTLKPEARKKKVDEPKTKVNADTCTMPRRQVPSSSGIANTTYNGIRPSPLAATTKETTQNIANIVNHADFQLPDRNGASTPSSGSSSPNDAPFDAITSNENSEVPSLKPLLTMPSLTKTKRKTVTFNKTPDVKEFQIPEGNRLSRNIKDSFNIRSNKKDFAYRKAEELKIEDFLARVFVWQPIWLQQQDQVKVLPPVVKPEDMQPLPITFNSFQQYYKRMEVLLLLETWQYLVKEFQCLGVRYKTSVVLPCKIERHSIQQMLTPNGLRYSKLTVHTVVSKVQQQRQNHPVYGDLMIIEYRVKQGTERKISRAFAYVTQVQQQNSNRFFRANEALCSAVAHPDVFLTYTVQTKVIDEHAVDFEEIGKIRSVLYLRSHLRLIQAIQFVPHSALKESVLEVNVDGFQLKPVTQNEIQNYKLVTQEKLNDGQLEAVIKFTTASVNIEPKIGLLIGPPGTGKSKVIANLVTEILYGDGRFVGGKPLRILVCAPSNAAIDEIVLRLLDIRSAIKKDHRFKMVRIGRIESMHEKVKHISLTELAKREAHKQHAEQRHKRLENAERQKSDLQYHIDALRKVLIGNPHNVECKRELERCRATYLKLSQRTPDEDAAELLKLQNSVKNTIVEKANIIACTLTSCYTSHMEHVFGGEKEKIATCIVDEATQCVEAETLIPLMLGVKSLILVGDPNQLPATVMSSDAKKLGLDRSLFTRVKDALEPQSKNTRDDNRNPILTLNVQYRMVNAISHWPNRYFYKGQLIDAVSIKTNFPFHPYRVLSLDGLQDDIKFSNTSEAVFVGNLVNCMMTYSKLNSDKKITIGIITPYQNQKSLILSTIRDQTASVPEKIKSKFITEVNTIDSFQGQERDVIIMSTVRSNGIGFLEYQQRVCVALTRAKFTLIILGNFSAFKKFPMWNDLLKDARSRGIVANLNTSARPSEIKPHVVKIN